MTDSEAIITILVMALATMITRFIPFLAFSGKRKTPGFIVYLGRVLPYSVIGMLVVYCFKEVKPLAPPYGLPEAVAGLVTAGVFLWRKNLLLAIAGGTLLYIFIVQNLQ